MQTVIIIVATALLSAALTSVIVARMWRGMIHPQLRQGADEVVADLEVRAKQIIDDLQHRADVVIDDFEVRARTLGDELGAEATAHARAELTAAAEAMVPRFRAAVRDGIQDAFLVPPERLGRTAKDVTSVGVNVIESTMRRLLGSPGTSGVASREDRPDR